MRKVNNVWCHDYQQNKNADVRVFEVREFISETERVLLMVTELKTLDIPGGCKWGGLFPSALCFQAAYA